MSEHFYSDAITRCKRRRTWGRSLVNALMLVALAALVGWLLTCVRHATVLRGVDLVAQRQGYLLAMAPVSRGMVVGALMSLTAMGIVLVVRRVRRHEIEAELQWTAKGTPLLCPDDQVKVLMGLEDLRGIVHASRVECRMAGLFVDAALTTTDLDEYGDALRAAQSKLAQVARTMGNLQQCLNGTSGEVRS